MEEKLNFVIITGLSGAGKTKTIGIMEDLGYFCIDNLPPNLIKDFLKISERTEGKINKICAVIDARSGEFLKDLPSIVEELRKDEKISLKVIFLEASYEVLVRRFSETRRKHPIDEKELKGSIERELMILRSIKKISDHVIDTSNFELKNLKQLIISLLSYPKLEAMKILILTFGYKYGIPIQSDIVLDVRFIPNPFYEEELVDSNGSSEKVKDYVLKFNETKEFLRRLEDFILYLIPYYIREGKSYLTVALGCTGGKHRSVAIGEILASFLKGKGYSIELEHRDVKK
ncbi:MAG: RNase adapter RapZ [Caldiserica bacterium CG02_land_8_20_14_3_00_36_38]|nr:RNase adapter RapZ [Caldisericota bacterium]PIV54747.1 MAG: RNase adapter RapZ [Caldiserica bacterium CG02_land_8_20_14_3_00_36_38]PIX28990.1 MAG: RNase adapter RapZ [Caldiserica bacterium CG_4_8_14_3_um_filter_35_18]